MRREEGWVLDLKGHLLFKKKKKPKKYVKQEDEKSRKTMKREW